MDFQAPQDGGELRTKVFTSDIDFNKDFRRVSDQGYLLGACGKRSVSGIAD